MENEKKKLIKRLERGLIILEWRN